jgi:hypothetical protein
MTGQAARVAEAQRLGAEYSVLVIYDDQRHRGGWDYGGGQRQSELARLRRELDEARLGARLAGAGDALEATPDQVREVYRELVGRRLGRYSKGRETTRAFRLAQDAWHQTAREIGAQ